MGVRLGEARVQGDGPLEGRARGSPVPLVVHLGVGQRRMGHGRSRVQLQRPLRRRDGAREVEVGRTGVVTDTDVAERQPGVGQRVGRVVVDGFVEVFDARLEGFGRALAQMVHAAQIRLVGLGVDRAPGS